MCVYNSSGFFLYDVISSVNKFAFSLDLDAFTSPSLHSWFLQYNVDKVGQGGSLVFLSVFYV